MQGWVLGYSAGLPLAGLSLERRALCGKVKKTGQQPKPEQTFNLNEFVGRLESTLAKVYQNKGL